MQQLDESTLVSEYMVDPNNDVQVINFINSPECTEKMINYINWGGWCALNLAARRSRYEVVEALIKKGVNVNQINPDDSFNALMYAINERRFNYKENTLKTIKLLINANINLNYQSNFSCFTLACKLEQEEVIELLLEHDINIDFQDKFGKTGMDYLIKSDLKDTILLVNKFIFYKNVQKNLFNKTLKNKTMKI